jgi:hypothetical protein
MKADELRALAIGTLVELCQDKQTGASARATAAKTLLQLGEINAFAPAQIEDEANSIDPDELEAQLKEKLERLLGPPVDIE